MAETRYALPAWEPTAAAEPAPLTAAERTQVVDVVKTALSDGPKTLQQIADAVHGSLLLALDVKAKCDGARILAALERAVEAGNLKTVSG